MVSQAQLHVLHQNLFVLFSEVQVEEMMHPAVVPTFHRCGSNGKVIFTNATVLADCDIELHGTLLVRIAIQSQSLLAVKASTV
jgi:hypothetical protein